MIQIEITFKDHTTIFAKRRIDNWDVKLRNNADTRIGSHEDNDIAEMLNAVLVQGYTRITAYVEDSIVVVPEPGKLIGFDVLTGDRAETLNVDDKTLVAVLCLALGGDEVPGWEKYYPLAEKCIANWPSTVRPIP